jgi:hypothetical protein
MAAASTVATYRIGPSDTFTGGDLKADADTLNGQVEDLDGQTEGNESLQPSDVEQWVSWQGKWAAFYANDFGGTVTNLLTALNDSNRDQLIQYEKDFANFATTFASSGITLAGGVVQPSTGSGDTLGAQLAQQLKGLDPAGILPSSTTVIIVLVLIVAALFIFKEG